MTYVIFKTKVGDILQSLIQDLKSLFLILDTCQKENSNLLEFLMQEQLSPHLKVEYFNKSSLIVQGLEKMKYIHILVRGEIYILNYTLDGNRVIADKLKAPQMLGLIEAISNEDKYSSSVVSLTDCTLIKVDSAVLIRAINSNLDLSKYVIKYLASFSKSRIENISKSMSLSKYENLLFYLHSHTIGNFLPVIITENKSFIADYLNINNRTLYRYLDRLDREDIISRKGQSIVINSENYKNLILSMT